MASTALQITPLRLQPTTVPPGPGRPDRPALRVLQGGRAPSRVAQQALYRRRRLAVALLAVVLVATLVLASAALARIAGGAPPAAGGQSPAVVVQPGDTLWSIAAAVAPEVDVRLTIDQLVALNGGAPIVVGQELVLP